MIAIGVLDHWFCGPTCQRFNTSIVFPDPVTGMLEFVDQGRFSGSCSLSCHGVPHSPLSY